VVALKDLLNCTNRV